MQDWQRETNHRTTTLEVTVQNLAEMLEKHIREDDKRWEGILARLQRIELWLAVLAVAFALTFGKWAFDTAVTAVRAIGGG